MTPNRDLPANVVAALVGGNKIQAIKLLREQTGLGLKEAMDVVESSGIAAAPKAMAERSPGEAPRSRTGWLVAGAVVAGAVGYYFVRHSG